MILSVGMSHKCTFSLDVLVLYGLNCTVLHSHQRHLYVK